MMRTAKNASGTFKNHPRNILHGENYLFGIILVHLTLNTTLKIRKHLQAVGYRI